MTRGGFAFHIEVRREGSLVGTLPASLASCREDALYREIVEGRVENDGSTPTFAAAPIWREVHSGGGVDGSADPPRVHGDPAPVTAIELAAGNGAPRRYPKEAFAAQARVFIEELTDQGRLAAGERVEWGLAADRDLGPPPRAYVSREPLPLSPAQLPELASGETAAELESALFEQLRAEFCRAGPVERAWLLMGTVLHDRPRGSTAVHAVAAVHVASGRGGASRTHFAFEPEAFAEARRRAVEEFDGLVPVGWAHSHPPCDACPANPACESDTRFFSRADIEVHSSAFPSPYMVALVVGKSGDAPATHPGFRLYGWRDAQVEEIPYRSSGGTSGEISGGTSAAISSGDFGGASGAGH